MLGPREWIREHFSISGSKEVESNDYAARDRDRRRYLRPSRILACSHEIRETRMRVQLVENRTREGETFDDLSRIAIGVVASAANS